MTDRQTFVYLFKRTHVEAVYNYFYEFTPREQFIMLRQQIHFAQLLRIIKYTKWYMSFALKKNGKRSKYKFRINDAYMLQLVNRKDIFCLIKSKIRY